MLTYTWTIERLNEAIADEGFVRIKESLVKIRRAVNSTLVSDVYIENQGNLELGEAVRYLNAAKAFPVFSERRLSNLLWRKLPVSLDNGDVVEVEEDSRTGKLRVQGKAFKSLQDTVTYLNARQAFQVER